MRASFAAVVAFAAVASASAFEKRQGIPACALTCMASAETGTCGQDNACLCKSDAFVQSTYNCIASTCKGDDLTNAVAAARELCRASGVTLTQTIPASTDAASATATAPSTASATSAASSTPTSASNSAIITGASPMVGALAAMAGFVFAL